MTDNTDVVIIDKDESFLKKLVTMISNEDNGRYHLHAFSQEDMGMQYLEKEGADILMVDDDIHLEDIQKVFDGKVLFLTEDKNADGIFKYSSGKAIVEAFYEYNNNLLHKKKTNDKKTFITGVTSFGDIGYKTGYALALASSLSELKKVLYINFDIYAGWEGYMSNKNNISDILYRYSRHDKTISEKFNLNNNFGFDLIMPAKCPEDIIGLKKKEISDFLNHIAQDLGYDYIIIDADYSFAFSGNFIELCDELDFIYSDSTKCRMKEFKDDLERSRWDGNFDKFKSVKINEKTLPHRDIGWWDSGVYGWYDLIKYDR